MPLDPHDHGATSGLRIRSVASGTALERELRVERSRLRAIRNVKPCWSVVDED
jgi:hypothetical protein